MLYAGISLLLLFFGCMCLLVALAKRHVREESRKNF
jgi:hypothetical protein